MTVKTVEKSKEYTVINGCNTSDGERWEIGDPMSVNDVPDGDIEALLEMNCIEVSE